MVSGKDCVVLTRGGKSICNAAEHNQAFKFLFTSALLFRPNLFGMQIRIPFEDLTIKSAAFSIEPLDVNLHWGASNRSRRIAPAL